VVVLLHGGFWKALYTKRLMSPLAEDVAARGWAAWNLEYRRIGSVPSGGWPGTFEDVAAGVDHLAQLAGPFHLDVTRVIAVGHSAGGHLALWAAGRNRLPPGAPGAKVVVALAGAIGLAPVADLLEATRLDLGGGAASRLLGGGPDRHPGRYAWASPAALLPFGIPQVVVHGDHDATVPTEMSRRYVDQARAAGDDATLVELSGGHMELIDPSSAAWSATVGHARRLLR
jgi:acetyl esterase/lipase